MVLKRSLRVGCCSCAVELFFTVNWVVSALAACSTNSVRSLKSAIFLSLRLLFYWIFAPLRLQIGWQLLHNRLHVLRMVQNCHVCVGFHCVLAFG